jgi:hypothetical protein
MPGGDRYEDLFDVDLYVVADRLDAFRDSARGSYADLCGAEPETTKITR